MSVYTTPALHRFINLIIRISYLFRPIFGWTFWRQFRLAGIFSADFRRTKILRLIWLSATTDRSSDTSNVFGSELKDPWIWRCILTMKRSTSVGVYRDRCKGVYVAWTNLPSVFGRRSGQVYRMWRKEPKYQWCWRRNSRKRHHANVCPSVLEGTHMSFGTMTFTLLSCRTMGSDENSLGGPSTPFYIRCTSGDIIVVCVWPILRDRPLALAQSPDRAARSVDRAK